MRANRWQQLEGLYDAAMELPVAERAKFAQDACAEDDELRRDLMGLLSAEQNVGNFMESPALEVAAKGIAQDESAVTPSHLIGGKLGPYTIEHLLGEGGMGQVYLAHDSKLKRQIALKVLPSHFVSDPERVRRFEREARAVSALNHPNLITIYDIGVSDGVHFIATEFVLGKTVRDLINDGLKMKDALAIATQVAEGLGAAHNAGILHRDIKPENIMVRPDGYVKVLDFGLAKLSEQVAADPSRSSLQTEPGLLMGTLAYMSPEQAAGEPVDQRADIWSLGIVLYEMMTGSSPTKRANRVETLRAILSNDPLATKDSDPALPMELDHILSKALEKDPELRYQTASDFRADLKRLKREIDSSPSRPGRVAPSVARVTSLTRLKPRRAYLLMALVAIGLLLGAWFLLMPFFNKEVHIGPNWAHAQNGQLTTKEGSELFPSLGPDGKSFLYVSDETGNHDIYSQRVGGKNPTNLTKDSDRDDTTPAFSPDGNLIAFHSRREPAGLYIMEATGENPRRISDVGFHPSWSPDGKEIVVGDEWIGVHSNKSSTPSSLWIISVDSGKKRLLTKGDAAQPSWSPGGKRIAFWYWSPEGHGDIATISAEGGSPVSIVSGDSIDWNPIWSPDGNFLYFASDRGGSMNVWRVAVSEQTGEAVGAPEAIQTTARYAFNISFSGDGKSLVYVRYESIANIQSIAFDPLSGKVTGDPSWVTRGYAGVGTAELSPDGKNYVARWVHPTQEDIVVFNKDGSNMRALTDDKFQDRRPRWFPDGKRVLFTSDRSGANQIWAINADGTGVRQLTFAAVHGASTPVLAPDGGRLAYLQRGNEGQTTCVVNLNYSWQEQSPESFPPVPSFRGHFSPSDWSADGEKLIGTFVNEDGNEEGIGTFSFTSRTYQKVLDSGSSPSWLRDNRRFIFIQKGTIYLGDTLSSKAQPIFSPSSYVIQQPAIASDHKTIYFRFLQVEADVWSLSLE